MSRAMSGPARFITFEGVEGSGKSLQLAFTARYLRSCGLEVVTTREPGGTAFGLELRRILLDTHGPARVPAAELLLYLADRVQHLQQVVEPALVQGRWVLSDRYHDATLAYQGYARGLGIDWIQETARPLRLRIPDLVVLLDLPVDLALARARHRNHSEQSTQGRFEAESLAFHQRVRDGYLQLASAFPNRYAQVDATGTPDEVSVRIRAIFVEKFQL